MANERHLDSEQARQSDVDPLLRVTSFLRDDGDGAKIFREAADWFERSKRELLGLTIQAMTWVDSPVDGGFSELSIFYYPE